MGDGQPSFFPLSPLPTRPPPPTRDNRSTTQPPAPHLARLSSLHTRLSGFSSRLFLSALGLFLQTPKPQIRHPTHNKQRNPSLLPSVLAPAETAPSHPPTNPPALHNQHRHNAQSCFLSPHPPPFVSLSRVRARRRPFAPQSNTPQPSAPQPPTTTKPSPFVSLLTRS